MMAFYRRHAAILFSFSDLNARRLRPPSNGGPWPDGRLVASAGPLVPAGHALQAPQDTCGGLGRLLVLSGRRRLRFRFGGGLKRQEAVEDNLFLQSRKKKVNSHHQFITREILGLVPIWVSRVLIAYSRNYQFIIVFFFNCFSYSHSLSIPYKCAVHKKLKGVCCKIRT